MVVIEAKNLDMFLRGKILFFQTVFPPTRNLGGFLWLPVFIRDNMFGQPG